MTAAATTTYPFLEVSDDVDRLIADAYVLYEDAACAFTYPFRVAWLYGFGFDPVPPIVGFPTPSHVADVVIRDNTGATVFDSTLEGTFYTMRPWANRFYVHEWRRGFSIIRLVQYKAYGVDEPIISYPIYVAPTNAKLHQRTVERWLPQVTEIRVGNTSLKASDVELVEGYNVSLSASGTETADGRRTVEPIVFNAVPGDGEGRAPGCNEEPEGRPVYSVNGIRPDSQGVLDLSGDRCFVVSRLSFLETATSPGDFPEQYLRTSSLTPHTILINNQCRPCCDCDDYVNVYQALTNLNTQLTALMSRAESTRNKHSSNISRWNIAASCRAVKDLNVSLLPVCGCLAQVSYSFCNTAKPCIFAPFVVQIEVLTTLSPYLSGIAPNSAFFREFFDSTYKPAAVLGTWPKFRIQYSGMNKGTFIRGKLDLWTTGCKENSALSVRISVIWGTLTLATRTVGIATMIPKC